MDKKEVPVVVDVADIPNEPLKAFMHAYRLGHAKGNNDGFIKGWNDCKKAAIAYYRHENPNPKSDFQEVAERQ